MLKTIIITNILDLAKLYKTILNNTYSTFK